MRKLLNIALIFLATFAVLGIPSMLNADWGMQYKLLNWSSPAVKKDTICIKARTTGADSIKLDTAYIELKHAGLHKLKRIGFYIKDAREWDSTHLTKATCSLTVRVSTIDHFGNWKAFATVMAYDSTKRYVARDSLRKGYWYYSLMDDTTLGYYFDAWDSVYLMGGVKDSINTAHKYRILGSGLQFKYDSLGIVLKTVAFDSTADIDSTWIYAIVEYE